ncbi:helix-hairpin-helix domain-containing protein [Streptomyces sp. cmx-10-25]|uniref:helix-hairpin-helix domain-containing protein n=1 Tax=Streptomyces sp. cmx-10-25 TaxID=2790919 RepID=UPI003980DB62
MSAISTVTVMTLRTRIASSTADASTTPIAGTMDAAAPGALGTAYGPTSGPGRAGGSDGRSRPGGRGSPPGRGRRRVRAGGRVAEVAEGVVRRRGDALFPTVPSPEPYGEPETSEAPGRVSSPVPPPGVRERLVAGIRDRTPLWVQTRCGLEPRTLAALTVVLLVAAGLAGGYFWMGRPEPVRAPELVRAAPATVAPKGRAGAEPEPEARQEVGSPATPPVPPPAPPVPLASSGTKVVVVDVGGKVRRPGVLTLPAGSRVEDALQAAGGVRSGADLTGVNRARVLSDGEQVLVDVPGAQAGGPGPGSGGSAGGAGGGGVPGAPVSLNTATVEQLDTLPGVGPVLAQHIVDHRTEHGGFRSVSELREVSGIGERRFADLEPLVRP